MATCLQPLSFFRRASHGAHSPLRQAIARAGPDPSGAAGRVSRAISTRDGIPIALFAAEANGGLDDCSSRAVR
ncbi:hypothetical protein BTO02_16720 [Paraburkholderia sp. SOS3]|nr:hypothetical protein BTO02_16720 [Paraburkholderia sp. SOS3]